MTPTEHAPITRELTADDLQWDLQPRPAVAVDLMNIEEILTEALIDAESYRAVAQEAIHALADLTAAHRRLEIANRQTLKAMRALCHSTRSAG